MSDEGKAKPPMIGYRHELTENGKLGLVLLFGGPLGGGIFAGIALSGYSPDVLGASVAMIAGSFIGMCGAVIAFICRQYMPFEAYPPTERDKWWDENRGRPEN